MHPLVEEAMKKAAIVWLSTGGRPYGVWCLWVDDALYVVSGPGEQPAPGLAEATGALVTARGDHGGRIVTWPAAVSRLAPGTPEWDTVTAQLAGKRLNLLLELVPQAATIGYLSGPPVSPIFQERKNEMLAAGRALERRIAVLEVRYSDFEAAFTDYVEQHADALIVGSFTLFRSPDNCSKILDLVARHRIAAMYPARQFPERGGLMSYDSDILGIARRLGSHYVGRILKGANPADLPVQGPGKFELVINLNAAEALGLAIPRTLFAAATDLVD